MQRAAPAPHLIQHPVIQHPVIRHPVTRHPVTQHPAAHPPLPTALLLLFLSCIVSGCSLFGSGVPGVPKRYSTDEVPAAMAEAQSELERGDTRRALARVLVAGDAGGLAPGLRAQLETLLDQAARARLEALSGPDGSPKQLARMVDLDIPRRIAVRAGVRGAQLYFERGERQKAFELIQRVDTSYPHHFERQTAGRVVGDVGFSFAEDGGRYGLFFHYRTLAYSPLHYLVETYPGEPRCDQAYATLAALYERAGRWALAVENHEDLILWYPESPLAESSEAAIPRLRLRALRSPEYDRTEVEQAERELLAWLGSHSGSPLEAGVREDLGDARRRLADHDLLTARFYARVDNAAGAEFHARRAVKEALEAGDPDQVEEAQGLLSDLTAQAAEAAAEAAP